MNKEEHIRRFKTYEEYRQVFGENVSLDNYPCVSFVDENKMVYFDDIPDMNEFFSLSVNGTNKTFYTDETETSKMKNKIEVKLIFADKVGVMADYVPSGWSEQYNEGEYTYSIILDSEKSYVSPTEFCYTIKDMSEHFNGITLKAVTEQYQINAIDCAYYGLATAESIKDGSFVKNLTRVQSDFDELVDFTNTYDKEALFVILTGGTAIATQSRFEILSTRIKNKFSFNSPINSKIKLTGYKLYKSKNKVASGSEMTDVMIHITLSNPTEPAPVPVIDCCGK